MPLVKRVARLVLPTPGLPTRMSFLRNMITWPCLEQGGAQAGGASFQGILSLAPELETIGRDSIAAKCLGQRHRAPAAKRGVVAGRAHRVRKCLDGERPASPRFFGQAVDLAQL